jgi:multimeric flavodoxin WrbA
MANANVLVVFWSRWGETERLALAAAEGAVQGRANIRLRWLREEAPAEQVHSDPAWEQNRARMEKEYIAPRAVDVEWATGVVLATPGRGGSEDAQWDAFFALGSFQGKHGATPGGLAERLTKAGVALVDHASGGAAGVDLARLLGRRVAESARSAA